MSTVNVTMHFVNVISPEQKSKALKEIKLIQTRKRIGKNGGFN